MITSLIPASQIIQVLLLSLRFLAAFSCLGRLRQMAGVVPLSVLCLSLAVSRVFALPSSEIETGNIFLLGSLAMKNVFLGTLCALPLGLLSEIGPMAARMIDLARGSQYAEQILPGAEMRTSHGESLAVLLGLNCFFLFGGHLLLLRRMLASPIIERPLELAPSLVQQGLEATFISLRFSVGLAGPALLSFLAIEIGLALISKFGGKVALSTEFQGLKLSLGLSLLGFALCESLPFLLGTLMDDLLRG